MKQLLARASFMHLQATRGPLLQHAALGYKTVVQRRVDPLFEEEKRVYAEEMRKLRKQHLKDYWERQTQVENAYLEKFQTEQRAKQRRDMDKWRTAVCNIAMHTKKQITDLQKKEQNMLEKIRRRDMRDTKKAMDNRVMLDVMQVDSRKWPTLSNLNEKVDENVVLPQTILNYGEYQHKL